MHPSIHLSIYRCIYVYAHSHIRVSAGIIYVYIRIHTYISVYIRIPAVRSLHGHRLPHLKHRVLTPPTPHFRCRAELVPHQWHLTSPKDLTSVAVNRIKKTGSNQTIFTTRKKTNWTKLYLHHLIPVAGTKKQVHWNSIKENNHL